MTNYDDVSDEEARLAVQVAGDAELDDTLERPAPEDAQIVDVLDSETLASWNLRRIRQVLGVSQQQIADRLVKVGGPVRLSQSQIAKIERGERPWRVNEMFAIANALGVNFLEFFHGQHFSNDEEMRLLAARLRYQRACEAEEEAREAWREAAKATRAAGELLVRVAADLGVRDPDAMQVLESRWAHQRYVEEVKEELEGWPDLGGAESRMAALKAWAEERWSEYLEAAQGEASRSDAGESND